MSHDFSTVTESYLDELQLKTSEEVYQEHSGVLSEFEDWCGEACTEKMDLNEQVAAWFLQYTEELEETTFEKLTYQNVLKNLVSYSKQKDPEQIRLYTSEEQVWLLENLHKVDLEEPPVPSQPHEHPWTSGDEDSVVELAVREVRSYLEEHKFGSIEQAYLELVIANSSENHDIWQLDIDDVDLAENTVVVDFNSEALVVDLDMVEKHTIKLTDHAAHVVRTYLQENRIKPKQETEVNPLFTTENGRMSEQTLKKVISEAITEASAHAKEVDGESDIEQYAAKKEHKLSSRHISRAADVPDYVDYPRIYHM